MGQANRKGEEQGSITEKEKKLIRDSWDAFCSEHRNYGVVLFSALFIKHPEYQQLFRHFRDVPVEKLKDIIRFRTHACAVGGQFTSIVETLDEPELLEQVLRKNALFHTNKQGVKPEHFAALGRVVIEVLTASNENVMTPAAVHAWEKLFEMVNACTMAVFETKAAQSSNADLGVASRKMSTDQGGALLSSSSQNAFQPPPLSQPDTALPSGAEREPADSDKPALPPTSSVARKASSCLSPAEASPPALSAGADADPSSPSMQQKLRRPSSRVSIVDEKQVTSPGADELIRASTSCPAAALQGVSKESAPLQGKDSNRRSSRISASSDSEKALSTQASKTSRKASVVLPASSPGDASEGGSSLSSQDKAKRRSSRQSGSSQSEKPVSTECSGGSRKASYASPASFDSEAASQSQEGAKINPSRRGEPSDTEEAVSSNLPGSPCNASDDETSSRSDRSGKRRPSRQRRRSEPQQGGSSRKPSCASPTQSSDVAVDGDAQGRQRRRSVQKRQSDFSGVKLSESTPDASSPAVSPVPSASASTQSLSSDKAENLGSPAPKADSGGSKILEGPSDTSGPKE